MKGRKWISLFLAVVLLLTGCGGKRTEPGSAGTEELYDLELTEKTTGLTLQEGELSLGAQYYNGESLWFVGNGEGQVFCCHGESGERELFLAEIPRYYKWYNLYRDGEHVYAFNGNALAVLDLDGGVLCTLSAEGRIQGVSISKEGSIVVASEDAARQGTMLQTLDLPAGTLSGGYALSDCAGIAQGAGTGIMVMDSVGVYDLDMESGEKTWHIRWSGTSYTPGMNMDSRYRLAFMLDGEGRLEQLQRDEESFYVVSLRKLSIEEIGKAPLVLRVLYAGSGLKQIAAAFNRENREYHVFLQDGGEEYGWDYEARTDMEIATGRGPDLFDDSAVSDMHMLAEKGALENLEGYLAQWGMDRADYYPGAFQDLGRGDGIYGTGYEMRVVSMYIGEAFLGAQAPLMPDSLLYNMEGYGGQAIFNATFVYTPGKLLEYFLLMSEDLYGMVDWEQKTCDFSGELWEKMLRVAKRYGVTDRNRGGEEIANPEFSGNFRHWAAGNDDAVEAGMVLAGYPSENGMVHILQTHVIAVNAASENKEGALQFIEFLLREENQVLVEQENWLPVHRGALEQVMELQRQEPYSIDPDTRESLYPSEEQTERFLDYLNGAEPEPYRTDKVVAIIIEEAESYFAGDKSIEEISSIIENRVRLYLVELE